MSQVSYGTITIVDTTDIARIYMVYAKSVSNTTPPSDELTWSESIASALGEGDFIWQKTVVEKAITEEKTYSDPVCVTGSSGQGVEKIINYYCNYGQGQPEEDYSGWQLEIPEYDTNKPNYWIKIVTIYADDTREDFQASGTIATFESEKVGIFDSLEVSLLLIQDTSGGAPSPSNICPISGWDSVDVSVCGINVWDEEWEVGSINNTTGLPSPDPDNIRAKNYCPCTPDTSYYFMIGVSLNIRYFWYDAEYNLIDNNIVRNNVAVSPSNARYFKIRTTNSYGATYNHDISINYPSTDHDYHAYNGQTYQTTLPQTVYGGTLDVVNGTLTVDRAMVDLGTLTWSYSSTSQKFATVMTNKKVRYSADVGSKNVWCSALETVGAISSVGVTVPDCVIFELAQISGSNIVCATNSAYTDGASFKTAMTGQTMVYFLATPTTIQLTPTQIDSLLGRNNVWSDGTVEVEGHTISKRDVMIYKDNGLTDVVNKSAEANTNAAEALEKANDGIVSTTQLWYQTNSTGALRVPTSHSQVDQGTVTYNNWRSVRPNNSVDSYKYYYYCYEYLHGDGTYTYSAEAILDTSNLSQYQIDQLQVRIKKMWSNSTGSYMASGVKVGTETREVDINDSSTYGFNSKSTTTGVSFNYNTIPLTSLGTDGIKLYSPTLTNGVITGSRLDATLNTNGLFLNKGGIKAGEGTSNFIYLSTDPYGNYSINGSSGISDWKQIIGTKFGVRADGTLYASNANISGAIDATSFTAKSYTGTTLNRQMSLGADGLKLMDGSGTILSQIDGSASTIGKTSGNSYNINITGSAIDLRYNTNVLNRIDDSGMIIYDGNGVEDSNTIAEFGTDGAQVGQSNGAHLIIDSKGQKLYGPNGLDILFHTGYGEGRNQDDNIVQGPFYTIGQRREGLYYYSSSETYDIGDICRHFDSDMVTRSYICIVKIEQPEPWTISHWHYIIGLDSCAEGNNTTASGGGSHAEGYDSKAIGRYSHAEGFKAMTIGNYSHAEGYNTTASGSMSHAEGNHTVSGDSSHAEGSYTEATGSSSHAEGSHTEASGPYSHAEGVNTEASGNFSHAQNRNNIAGYSDQTVIGKFNNNQSTTAFEIGNGVDSNTRSNALTVDWNGDISRYTGWDGSSIPSAENGKHYEALDTSGRWVGRVSSIVYSGSSSRSGQVGTLIRARHPSAPNNPNTIGIYVDDTGAMDYTISSPSAFRSALGIAVAVVGTGSSNGWVWRKYSDNTFDAWYSGTATTAINSVVGSLYQSGSNLTLTMPSGIGATSVLYGDVNLITSSYGVWTYIITLNSTTFSYRGMSALSRASASYTVKAYVRGAYS